MLGLTFLLLAVLTLSHWLLAPFATVSTAVFNLSWLGWALLAVAVWLFAGERRSP